MKKKLVIGGGLGIISFIAGLLGFYLLMPKLAPDRVENTKLTLDSLGLLPYEGADSVRAVRDSLSMPDSTALLDSNTVAAQGLPGDAVLPEDAAAGASGGIVLGGQGDSLRFIRQQMRALEAEKAALASQVERLTSRIETIENRRVEAEKLGENLAKLEDKQLTAILKDLDIRVVELLYHKASARNQTRLLQAMPPDRAAQFIRSLVRMGPAAEPAASTTQAPSTPPQDPPH